MGFTSTHGLGEFDNSCSRLTGKSSESLSKKNLHPIITSYLIKLFNEKIFNPKNAQLIFATHDVTQLNEELFNRDQVWFTQKNEFGVTELIRCSDIKGLRLNAPLDKWYVAGRLGGTAIINDTNFVMAMQEEIEE